MNLDLSTQELEFRAEVRGWLDAHVPPDLSDKVLGYEELTRDDLLRWHRILAQRGWIAPAWPREWGGTGWTPVQRHLFEEECALAAAPPVAPFGITMCAPVLLRFGTDAQRHRFLPRIYHGEEFWCQGYSEPGAGSDLASLTMRAVRRGEEYVLNGQKIWTTLAHFADWMFCLVRTGTDGRRRQDGISFLLVDMKTPGITVRPLILLDEAHEVNEVFFDDVRVPVENLVHRENEGWTVAKYLLGYERLNTGRIGVSKRELARLKEVAARTGKNGRPLLADVRFRDRLARVEIELMALEMTNLRFVDEMQRTGTIGPEVSMLKIRGTEIQQELTELHMQAVGRHARRFRPIDYDGFDRHAAALAPRYFNFRKTSIYAGSNEIQRNLIAKNLLGL